MRSNYFLASMFKIDHQTTMEARRQSFLIALNNYGFKHNQKYFETSFLAKLVSFSKRYCNQLETLAHFSFSVSYHNII